MELLIYLLKVSACLTSFFAFYLLVLKNLTFFSINRFYLLAALLLSFAIPALHFNVERKITQPRQAVVAQAPPNKEQAEIVQPSIAAEAPLATRSLNWPLTLRSAYVLIAAALIVISFWRLALLLNYIKRSHKTYFGLRLVDKKHGFTNCSFFNYVFVDQEKLNEQELSVLLRHEQVHAQQFHSLDKIVMMFAKAVLWFNPVIYLWEKALEQVHEYEADALTSKIFNTENYAHFLLNMAMVANTTLVHNFGKKPIKARIKMLYHQKSNHMKKSVYVLAMPICFGLIWSFSVTFSYAQSTVGPAKDQKKAVKTIKIITSKPKSKKLGAKKEPDTEKVYIIESLAPISIGSEAATKIVSVENSGEYTVVNFETTAPHADYWVLLNKEIYIQADNDMKHFNYVKSENIPLAPTKHAFVKEGEKLAFKVYFEKVPATAKSIDVIERAGRSDFFNFFDVSLP